MNLFDKAKRLLGHAGDKQPPAAKNTVSAIPQDWLNAAQAEVGSLLSRDEVEAARHSEQAHDVDTTALREAMLNHLNDDTLPQIAEQVGLAPSQLFGGKGRKVMGLLQHAERHKRVTDLLTACQTLMPDVSWQKENIE